MQNNRSDQGGEHNGLAARAPGIFILLISLGAAYYFIAVPLMDMLNGREAIRYYTEGVVISTAGLLFGLIYTLFGRNDLEQLLGSSKGKSSKAGGIIFIILFLVVVFGCLWAWTSLVNGLGYGSAY
jgi:hypothetical protein